jgi:hypothetical protein
MNCSGHSWAFMGATICLPVRPLASNVTRVNSSISLLKYHTQASSSSLFLATQRKSRGDKTVCCCATTLTCCRALTATSQWPAQLREP